MTNFELAAQIGYETFATKGTWFRVTGARGNAKGNTGIEGRLMWLGVEGDPKAWSSSPNRLRVTRVGIAIEGRSGLLFLAPNHVTPIAGPTSPESLIAIEIMCLAIAGAA